MKSFFCTHITQIWVCGCQFKSHDKLWIGKLNEQHPAAAGKLLDGTGQLSVLYIAGIQLEGELFGNIKAFSLVPFSYPFHF